MFSASNLNTRLKRIILFTKIVWFFLNNNYRSSSISQKISESQRNRVELEFHAALTHSEYIDIWSYFRNLMHYLSNPMLTSKISREESKFASAVYCITLPRLHRATFSLFFRFHGRLYLLKNSQYWYASLFEYI